MTPPTITLLKRQQASARRPSFTLVEMTIVVMVIAILAALALPVFNAAAQQAKVHRTRAIIAKIDQLIGEKWEEYRTRPMPIRINPSLGLTPQQMAGVRLNAMRELQRFELPDRITDIAAGPRFTVYTPMQRDLIPSPNNVYPIYALAALNARPAVNKHFLLQADKAHPPGPPPWAATGIEIWQQSGNESAECLYLILSVMRDGDRSALDWFAKSEIGDTDDDGMNEILDAWGQPIMFLRWAPGYRGDLPPFPATPQRRNDSGLAADPTTYPDAFDPFRIDARWSDGNFLNDPIALKPLIWSFGPDKKGDISVSTAVYAGTTPPNDPYYNGGTLAGAPTDFDGDGLNHGDNITNHDLEAK